MYEGMPGILSALAFGWVTSGRAAPVSARHPEVAARDAGIEPRVVFRPGLALDLDRPADLEELVAEGAAGWPELPLLRPAEA